MRLTGELTVRVAVAGEEGVVLDILGDAARWLRERGIDQWQERFPEESVRAQVAAEEALIVERAGQLVATLVVADREPELWGAAAEPALYVSRLAGVRSAAGRGLGYLLVDWFSRQAARRGWRYVRLATFQHNMALRRYYERAGFEHVGDSAGGAGRRASTSGPWARRRGRLPARPADHVGEPISPTPGRPPWSVVRRSAEPPMAGLWVGRSAVRRCVDSRGSASALQRQPRSPWVSNGGADTAPPSSADLTFG